MVTHILLPSLGENGESLTYQSAPAINLAGANFFSLVEKLALLSGSEVVFD